MPDLTGGCFCDAIRYRISADPMVVSHCHCKDCRRATGAPFITWITLTSDGFEHTAGAPTEYHSTTAVRRGFCDQCGSTLSYRNVDHPEEIDISAATLDDPDAVTPDDHLWISSKVSWLKFDDGLPCLESSHWEHGYPKREKSE